MVQHADIDHSGLTGIPAAPQSARHVRSAGDYTTTSTTFVDVDATNMSLTITTGARRCMVGFVGSGYSTNASGSISLTAGKRSRTRSAVPSFDALSTTTTSTWLSTSPRPRESNTDLIARSIESFEL